MRIYLLYFTILSLLPCALAAKGTPLPDYQSCPGTFYGVSKYEQFSWAGHYRKIAGNTDQLKEGERLAFQATTKEFTNAHTETLFAISELRHLSLVATSVTDEGMRAAQVTTKLLSINIWSCPGVTNAGVAEFKNSADIYSASVGTTRSVDDEWMAVFEHWPKLKEVRIDGTRITGEGFRHCTHTPDLERIEGWNTFSISDVAFDHIAKLVNLRAINLWECRNTTSAGLQKLAACENLESVELIGVAGVDDALATALAKLESLRLVDLSYSKELTDKGVEALSKRKSLEVLDLDNCEQLTDKAVEHIGAIESLKVLKVGDCPKITTACLPHILKLTKLEAIVVPTSFGEEQRKVIRKAFPNIKFEFF
jgi:hypothetical protein